MKDTNTQHQSAYDPFLDDRMHHMHAAPPPPNAFQQHPPFGAFQPKVSQKGKFTAGFLAFCFPGLGHFYLGLMQRGFSVLLVFALNIVFLTYNASMPNGDNVPLLVLLGILVPALYFYNLFDALQCTDRVNAERMYGYVPEGMTPLTTNGGFNMKSSSLGIILVVCGVCVLMFSINPFWLQSPFIVPMLLIVAGLFLLLRNRHK